MLKKVLYNVIMYDRLLTVVLLLSLWYMLTRSCDTGVHSPFVETFRGMSDAWHPLAPLIKERFTYYMSSKELPYAGERVTSDTFDRVFGVAEGVQRI